MSTPSAPQRTLALLMDMSVPVQIRFGRTRIPLARLVGLTAGSLVELDRDADDQVEVIVNDRVVARGEIVELDGEYGVRIHSIEAAGDSAGTLSSEAVQSRQEIAL